MAEPLPPSALRVLAVIHEQGPATHAGLKLATGMPPRTIRFAVRRLRDAGLLQARASLRDCRTSYFFLASAPQPSSQRPLVSLAMPAPPRLNAVEFNEAQLAVLGHR